jgi:hypothetical protein
MHDLQNISSTDLQSANNRQTDLEASKVSQLQPEVTSQNRQQSFNEPEASY